MCWLLSINHHCHLRYKDVFFLSQNIISRSCRRTRIKKMKKNPPNRTKIHVKLCLSVWRGMYLNTLRFEISRIFYWPLSVCMTSYISITLEFESLSVWRHIFRYFRVRDFKASCMPPTSRRPSLFLKHKPLKTDQKQNICQDKKANNPSYHHQTPPTWRVDQ